MLIAVAGFSGAGKTSAIRYLAARGVGEIIYAGQMVLDEVVQRGLELCPENEKVVRTAMRQEEGHNILAKRVVARLARHPLDERILLDAIYLPEEDECYRTDLQTRRLVTLSIETSFETRVERLASRPDRPCSRADLEKRDRHEREELGLERLVAGADFRLPNEGTMMDFETALDALAKNEGWLC